MMELEAVASLAERVRAAHCEPGSDRSAYLLALNTKRLLADLEELGRRNRNLNQDYADLNAEARTLRKERDDLVAAMRAVPMQTVQALWDRTDDLAAMTAERDRLVEAVQRVRAIHEEYEGRCTHCVEWCDCIDGDSAAKVADCTHGNVEWPCKTATALNTPAAAGGAS